MYQKYFGKCSGGCSGTNKCSNKCSKLARGEILNIFSNNFGPRALPGACPEALLVHFRIIFFALALLQSLYGGGIITHVPFQQAHHPPRANDNSTTILAALRARTNKLKTHYPGSGPGSAQILRFPAGDESPEPTPGTPPVGGGAKNKIKNHLKHS